MSLLKEILFWWLLIDAILVIISKQWRKERISYLKRLDKKRAST
ncbi:hypothetical protein [Candidatus Stoquefichus sp. SB1]|nr:hypothetical protein [Candidatus Stoquefichus sp. SB1]